MSWIARDGARGSTSPQPKPPSAATPPVSSLEHPTSVRTKGASAAGAIIEYISASECRLRTVVFFDRGEAVEFDIDVPGGRRFTALGHVADRTSKPPRFVYRVRFDRMSGREIDELARAVAEMHRLQARGRSHRRAIENLPTTDGLVRANPRVVTHFPIFYRGARERIKAGKAGDVSAGGLSITCSDAFLPGEVLELRFTLPTDVLDVHPEETAVLDIRNRSVVRQVRCDLRRAFEEMTLRGRIVTHTPLGGGTYQYGVSFIDAGPEARAELARFVQAVQLAKRRSSQ